MTIAEGLEREFNHESTVTRKLLQRLPANLSWTPHPKSMTLGRLATHIAEIPQWAEIITGAPEFAMESGNHTRSALDSPAEILAAFEKNIQVFSENLRGKTDEELMRTWKFLAGGQIIVELPRVAALRSFVMSHIIHHRGQLSVYLRLNDVPLPSIYGPSADER